MKDEQLETIVQSRSRSVFSRGQVQSDTQRILEVYFWTSALVSLVLERLRIVRLRFPAATEHDLCEALVRWVVDIYHNQPHEGLDGETPARCWRRLVAIHGVSPEPALRSRRLAFGTRMQRVAGKAGIVVCGPACRSRCRCGARRLASV